MVRSLPVLLFVCCAQVSYAQFNDTMFYQVNFTAAGIINKTNEGTSYVLNNNLRFNVERKIITVNTTNSWVYGEQRDVLTNNDITSTLDFNLFKNTRRIYYWGLATVEKSFSLKINHRLQSGIGIGYNVVNRERTELVISNGVLYEKSDLYDDAETGTEEYETLRNSFRIKFRFKVKELVILEGSDFLQHSLSDKKDYIIRSNTRLSVRLKQWLSFTVTLDYNKLNRTQRENLICNFGLTLEKYF